jgi:hypothetical protein
VSSVGIGPDQYTQDVAIIEIDTPKINHRTFTGSVIDLGFKYTVGMLTQMMYPNPKNNWNGLHQPLLIAELSTGRCCCCYNPTRCMHVKALGRTRLLRYRVPI